LAFLGEDRSGYLHVEAGDLVSREVHAGSWLLSFILLGQWYRRRELLLPAAVTEPPIPPAHTVKAQRIHLPACGTGRSENSITWFLRYWGFGMVLDGRSRLRISQRDLAEKIVEIAEPCPQDREILPGLREVSGWDQTLNRT
jgi:hypothetical protein